MSDINDKAWALLSEDEQLAVTLKYGHGKSTWEAGEIMSKSHYKFLEIESRGKKFLKIFTEHFEFYECLIPPYVKMDKNIRKYFDYTIGKRIKPKKAIDKINDNMFSIPSFRNVAISKEIERLVNHKEVVEKNLGNLILDFDRWNNYRILPLDIQEPSAFKRRNKNIQKNNIKNLLNLNTYTVEWVIKTYKFITKSNNHNSLYTPIFSKFIMPDKRVLKIQNTEENIAELSKIGLFIFPTEDEAWKLYDHIKHHDIEEPKTCKEGQRFWPLYRILVKKSVNYNRIQKRIPSRKFLEFTTEDIDMTIIYPKKPGRTNTKSKRRKKIKLSED